MRVPVASTGTLLVNPNTSTAERRIREVVRHGYNILSRHQDGRTPASIARGVADGLEHLFLVQCETVHT
jgi:hypothetical protein